MGYISSKDGSYYEGDKQYGDIDVPQRPSANHEWINGAWVEDVAKSRLIAAAAIDVQAGKTRLKYITDVAGQSETYLSKASDAAAYKTAGYPSAPIANYPMVQAEGKAIYGAAPSAVQYQAAADGIIATEAQWLQLAAMIEQQRRAGKIAVAGAATGAEVAAAQQAAIAALEAL
jgi:hypothetical protein